MTDTDGIAFDAAMRDEAPTTLETEIADDDAQSEIAEAVSVRHSIARKHVLRLRR